MSTPADDAMPRNKRADVKDLPAQPDGAHDVSGGSTVRSIEPCLKPAIEPCIKPSTLPGGIANPLRGH